MAEHRGLRITCDRCRKKIFLPTNNQEAIDENTKKKPGGWAVTPEGDLCPSCAEEHGKLRAAFMSGEGYYLAPLDGILTEEQEAEA